MSRSSAKNETGTRTADSLHRSETTKNPAAQAKPQHLGLRRKRAKHANAVVANNTWSPVVRDAVMDHKDVVSCSVRPIRREPPEETSGVVSIGVTPAARSLDAVRADVITLLVLLWPGVRFDVQARWHGDSYREPAT